MRASIQPATLEHDRLGHLLNDYIYEWHIYSRNQRATERNASGNVMPMNESQARVLLLMTDGDD